MYLSFHSFFKSIIFLILFSLFSTLQAQDSINTDKFRRNAVKIGTNLLPSKLFLSYEHALTHHISAGIMASYGGVTFPGYMYTVFTRYYFGQFNRSGWFVEARGSYAHFNPYVYTGYHKSPQYSDYYREYEGRHQATIDYWNVGISGGYKIFCSARVFFEFVAGAHTGKATFGANDLLLGNGNAPLSINDDHVQTAFDATGPGFPLHFMVQFGFMF